MEGLCCCYGKSSPSEKEQSSNCYSTHEAGRPQPGRFIIKTGDVLFVGPEISKAPKPKVSVVFPCELCNECFVHSVLVIHIPNGRPTTVALAIGWATVDCPTSDADLIRSALFFRPC